MDPTVPHPLMPTTRIELVRLPARAGDRWSLLSDYVDLVWTELLGVTAVAVARRLGHLLAMSPPARGVSLDSLATPLRIPPGKALDALRRLHHHRLVEFREHTAVLGVTGSAPSIPEERADQLSAYTSRLRDAVEARGELRARTPGLGPGTGSDAGGPRRITVEL